MMYVKIILKIAATRATKRELNIDSTTGYLLLKSLENKLRKPDISNFMSKKLKKAENTPTKTIENSNIKYIIEIPVTNLETFLG